MIPTVSLHATGAWQQRLVASLVGTSAARVLRMIATDRMQAARIATGGKDAHVVPRVYGRVGYDVPRMLLFFFALTGCSKNIPLDASM